MWGQGQQANSAQPSFEEMVATHTEFSETPISLIIKEYTVNHIRNPII